MNPEAIQILQNIISILASNSVQEYEYIPQHEKQLPSLQKLTEIVDLLRAIIFPGYFGETIVNSRTLEYHIGVKTENLFALLTEQIHNGLYFEIPDDDRDDLKRKAAKIALTFMSKIPELKRLVATDVKATFDGDPAATSFGEVIFCYPSIRAVFNHRVAHELLKLNVPIIPRVISELAHSETGIDIHPGAQIGEYFCIDHGTGVVIGETCIIGNRVRLYQGVTLGAKRFTLDENGAMLNVPRHPILEDNVVVYANANILGRITIGHDTIVGGNVWLTNSVPPDSRILQQKALTGSYNEGSGI